MQTAVDYDKILQKAYQISMYYVKEDDTAKDIAQATAIKYFLNVEKINNEKSNNWIFTVSKNLSLNHLKKYKRELVYSNTYFEEKNFENYPKTKKILTIDDIKIFNVKERNLLKQYYENSGDINKLVRKSKLNTKVLKNKIYNLEQERKLFELIYFGVQRTKSLPGTKLHRNIQNFLKKLKYSLNNGDLMKMKHYFSGCIINDEVSSIKIKKIIQYDIDILETNKYLLNIGYHDSLKAIKFFRIRFEISEGSTINVIEFLIMPKKVFAFNAKEIPIEILRQMQPNEKGVTDLTQDEFAKLLKSQKDKIKVIIDKNK